MQNYVDEKSQENRANSETLREAKEQSISRNKNIWVFNAGSHFSGNPKWLFLYILKAHKEITPIWLCYDKNLRAWMRQRGFRAYLFDSAKGKHYMNIASVYVVDQVKEVIQPELVGATILNLWHGVGCKTVERELHEGILEETVAKKYITNNSVYDNYQLFLVTSPLMEEHFVQQCGLHEDRLIRAAYPNTGSGLTEVSTFDHSIVLKKKLSSKTRVGLYAPTYRDDGSDFVAVALPDMDRLCKVLADNNELLIIKVHPQSERDYSFLTLKDLYSDNESLLFWDNDNDIYEIFDQIDFAIVDYSSIFYDLVAAGVSCFVRYFYDYDSEMTSREFFLDVEEYTCGQIAHTFDELLNVLGSLEQEQQMRTLIE